MALYICPDCGGKVSSRIDKCPKCGCPISIMQNQSSEKDEVKKTEKPVEVPKIVIEDTQVSAPVEAPKIEIKDTKSSIPVEEPQKSEAVISNLQTDPVVTTTDDITPNKSDNKSLYIFIGIAVVLLAVLIFVKFRPSSNNSEIESFVTDNVQPSQQEIIEEKPPVVAVEQNPEADKRLESFTNKLLDEPLSRTCKLMKVFKRDNSKSVFFIGNKYDACPQEGPCELCACFYVYDAIKDELRIYTGKNKFDVCPMSELNKVKVQETYDGGFELDKNVFYIDYSGENNNYFYPSGDDYVLFTYSGIRKIKLSDYSISKEGNPKSIYKVIDDKYLVEFTSEMYLHQGFDFDTATFVVRDIEKGTIIDNPFFKKESVVYRNGNIVFKLTIQNNGYVYAEVSDDETDIVYVKGCKKPNKDIYLYNYNINTKKIDEINICFQLKYIDQNKYIVNVHQSVGEAYAGITSSYEITRK